MECFQEFGGLYSCVAAFSVFPINQAYSIQLAAQNNFGDGSFSNPINVTLLSVPVSSKYLTWYIKIILVTYYGKSVCG